MRQVAGTRASIRRSSIALALFVVTACSHYRVDAGGTFTANPSGPVRHYTLNNYLWGLVQDQKLWVTCTEGDGLGTVTTTISGAHLAAMILTLGIWCPIDVAVSCSHPPASTGTIGDPHAHEQ